MASRTLRHHVAAPIAAVFDALTDLERAPERIDAIRAVEVLTPGPVGLGTRWQETRVVMKRAETATLAITAFDPPHGYTADCVSFGCTFTTAFRLTPAGPDTCGTDVEATVEARPRSLGGKLMAFALSPLLGACAKAVAGDLADIEAALARERGDGRARGATAGT